MFMEIEGTKLHYEVIGEGMPMIVIHGHSVDYRLMSGPMERCLGTAAPYRRIYFDLPGMGETKLEDTVRSWEDIRRILLIAISNLIGEEKCLLVGESFGAYMIRSILSALPSQVVGMAFICPWIPDITQKLPERVVTVRENGREWEQKEYDYFTGIAVRWNEEILKRYREDIEPGILLFDAAFDDLKNELTVDQEAVFYKPAVFLEGRQDHCAGYDAAYQLLEKYPRATYAIVDSCGHNMQIESEEMFSALFHDWLRRVQEYNS